MLLAVVSDTHGRVANTIEAVREIDRRNPDLVLHCGDIGSPAVVSLFAGRETRFVFGNVDDASLLRRAICEAGLICDEEFGEVTLGGHRIAFLHGHDERRLHQTIASGEFDLVCHGHTHRQRWQLVGTTRVLNPGAMHRATTHSIAFVTLPDLTVEFVTVPQDQ
jgi:putative phosphoesterase